MGALMGAFFPICNVDAFTLPSRWAVCSPSESETPPPCTHTTLPSSPTLAQVSQMTDVYSFGILLAFLFTGSHMAEAPSGVQVRLCSRPHCSGTLALSMRASSQARYSVQGG